MLFSSRKVPQSNFEKCCIINRIFRSSFLLSYIKPIATTLVMKLLRVVLLLKYECYYET